MLCAETEGWTTTRSGCVDDERKRREIAHRVVRQLAPERSVEGDRHARREQRVAVGLCLGDEVAADDLAGAGLVFDDDRLAELAAPERRDRAKRGVDAAARGDGNDQVHGPRRERLLRRRARGKRDARRGDQADDRLIGDIRAVLQ